LGIRAWQLFHECDVALANLAKNSGEFHFFTVCSMRLLRLSFPNTAPLGSVTSLRSSAYRLTCREPSTRAALAREGQVTIGRALASACRLLIAISGEREHLTFVEKSSLG
jgi:hypothetical protein